jgi:hypothetical protein
MIALPQLPPDKVNHAAYGAVLGFVGAIGAKLLGASPALGAVALAGGLGVAKEAYDRISKQGTPDTLDAIATAAGGVAVGFATLL